MRVVYIEPYPKSEALNLHSDAITCPALEGQPLKSRSTRQTLKGPGDQVRFTPFTGVAPRRYDHFFEMRWPNGARIERKNPDGTARTSSSGYEELIVPQDEGRWQREIAALKLLNNDEATFAMVRNGDIVNRNYTTGELQQFWKRIDRALGKDVLDKAYATDSQVPIPSAIHID